MMRLRVGGLTRNRNVRNLLFLLSFFCFFVTFTPSVIASEEYVLPYPGFMPGHPLYKISSLIDRTREVWSFGNFAKFKYHLSMADKKLIETKTLFEYKQFLLGLEALKQSDKHFQVASDYLVAAQKEKKNISQQQGVFRNAAGRHALVLETLSNLVPEVFYWRPEKGSSTDLPLKDMLTHAIKLRRETLQ